jgi:pantoate kinase
MELKLDVIGLDTFVVNRSLYENVLYAVLPDNGAGWKVTLKVRLQLPVAQGFGMSAAGALSTAIALWEAFYSKIPGWDRKLRFKAQQERYFSMKTSEFKIKPLKRRLVSPLQLYMKRDEQVEPVPSSGKASGMVETGGGIRTPTRWLGESQADSSIGFPNYSDCIAAAHRADILAKGGLGDVVAAARGGIEMRLAPGIPPFGEVHTVPVEIHAPPSVAVMVVGPPIDTRTVLESPARRAKINQAGEAALKNLLEDPSIDTLMREANQFSMESTLQSFPVRAALGEVSKLAKASQIMIGNSVFAFVGGISGLDQVKNVTETWRKRGKVTVCDIDLIGARPIN